MGVTKYFLMRKSLKFLSPSKNVRITILGAVLLLRLKVIHNIAVNTAKNKQLERAQILEGEGQKSKKLLGDGYLLITKNKI